MKIASPFQIIRVLERYISLCLLCGFLTNTLLFSFIQVVKKPIRVKGKSLVIDWTGGRFPKFFSTPKNLSQSGSQILVGDFLPARGEEIILYSCQLPMTYLLSANLSLLRKFPRPALPPKVLPAKPEAGSHSKRESGQKQLVICDGKGIYFFKGRQPLLLKKEREGWIKDFAIQASSNKWFIWTVEEEKALYLRLWEQKASTHAVLVGEREIPVFPSSFLVHPKEKTAILVIGKKILAWGDKTWEREISFPSRAPLSCALFSRDGHLIFLALSDTNLNSGRFYILSYETGQEEAHFPPREIFPGGFNDLALYDLDNDQEDEILLTFSGKSAGIFVLKAHTKVEITLCRMRRFTSSPLLYTQNILYLLGCFPTDEGVEIQALVSFEKGDEGESWLYRFSPELKIKDAQDLEDKVYSFALLSDRVIILGQNLNIYKWE